MKTRTAVFLCTLAAYGIGDLILPTVALAGNPFNMMNPSRWFGGKRDYYDDSYDDRYYGPPGYGYGAPGYGYGAPGYGYGAPGYGYAPPGYGYGAPPQPAPATTAPSSDDNSEAKIRALEERIRQLESSRPPMQPSYDSGRYQQPSSESGQAFQPAPYTATPPNRSYAPPPGSSFRPTN